MSDVHSNIISWLHEQKYWLQVAAKKLLEQGVISDEDIGELTTLLKREEGLLTDIAIDFSTFFDSENDSGQLRINSIGDIRGIENLSPRIPLNFGNSNLAVIYGNNGSGKSGYTRILKKVCGKNHASELKPNVFELEPDVRQCLIGFNYNDTEYTETWAANSDAIDALLNVDIFDSHSGHLYLNSENSAAYIPETVALFEDLVVVCKHIKKLLESEKGSLKSNLPSIPSEYSDTKYGLKLGQLVANLDADELRDFFKFSEVDQVNQASIEERLKDAPNVLAQQKRNHKNQLGTLINTVYEAVRAVNPDACGTIFQLQQGAKNKRKIAIEGASSASDISNAILPGIGTETWMAMWQAAREYSISTAYPSEKYPKTDDDSRCLLCHQSLDEEAKKRLQGFENFINSTLKIDAEKIENSYKHELDALPSIPTEQQLKTSLQAAKLEENVWFPVFHEIWGNIQKIVVDLKKEHSEAFIGYVLPEDIFKPIVELTESIEEQIQQHDSDAESFDKEQLTKDLNDLKAKQWASGYIDAIIEEVVRLGEIQSYKQWIEFTNPRVISIKAGDVSKSVITEAYIDRFNTELAALGAKNIKVELVKTRVDHGKVKHKVQLRGVATNSAKTSEILSEGEHRIVSLAAFLADVTGKPQFTPFIFDDPISSLDLDYEWEVAKRLVNLSIERQVIILTHRLSLYGAVEDCAKKVENDWHKKNLTQICIEAFNGTTGHMVPPDTWVANTKKANNILIDKLNNAKKLVDTDIVDIDINIYKTLIQGICSDFRKLLERTIEDDLLTKVVNRYRRSITTDGRLPKLSKISNDDCQFFDILMTKYSCYEHSQSLETPKFVPSHQELLDDLEKLKNWRSEFTLRSNEMVVGL